MTNYLNIFKEALIHGKLFFYASYAIGRSGIRFMPVYFTQEFPQVDAPVDISPRLKSLNYRLLTPSEIKEIYAHPEFSMNTRTKEAVVKENCLCYGLVQNDEIMSYMWCNLLRCYTPLSSFPIQKDEVYLFGAHTYIKYRGLNLAPYLRFRVYQSLMEMGRSRFYSQTEYFNTPAKKFKKKLKARHLTLLLYIKFPHIFQKEITLRKFRY